jgi:GDP-fucose transporter C1
LDAPLLVTWFQLVLALLLVIVLGRFDFGLKVPAFEFRPDIAIQVLPLSLLYVGMLATNNLCLTFVNMAFFQVARSLTIVFNILLTVVVLRTSVSIQTVLACVVVLIGFITASRGELEFSWIGTAFGIVASMFNALYSIYVKVYRFRFCLDPGF